MIDTEDARARGTKAAADAVRQLFDQAEELAGVGQDATRTAYWTARRDALAAALAAIPSA